MKKRIGFTLIEVALFLAVTGALFAGIVIGTQNSISQQRYNDAVQNFANFLRNIYAEVENPQSLGDGRSDKAIYGKVITFGERCDFDGNCTDDKTNSQKIFVYNLIGSASSQVSNDSILSILGNSDFAAGVTMEKEGEGDIVIKEFAGIVEEYRPIWGSAIDSTSFNSADNTWLYRGTVIVAKHPKSGIINTVVSGYVPEINEAIKNNDKDILGDLLDNIGFAEADFCVNPNGAGNTSTIRRDVRLKENAHSSSGVEVIDLDSDNNKCR